MQSAGESSYGSVWTSPKTLDTIKRQLPWPVRIASLKNNTLSCGYNPNLKIISLALTQSV